MTKDDLYTVCQKAVALPTFLADGTTQYRLARRVGLTPGAIHQMLRNDRNIWVTTADDRVAVWELKLIAAED